MQTDRTHSGNGAKVNMEERHGGGELLEAARTYPWRVAAPIVLFVAIAVAIAFLRPPTYTAEARLAVGRINVATTAAPGVVSASQSLASAYSRAIDATQVSRQIDRELPDLGGSSSVSASPIPESPVILLEAEASTAAGAIRLANSASRALIAYINELNSNAAEDKQLLADYRAARGEVSDLQAEVEREEGGGAQSRLETARLKVRALEQAYRISLEENTSGNDLRVLTTATAASSDRGSVLKLLLVGAVLAGTGVGLLLAYASLRL